MKKIIFITLIFSALFITAQQTPAGVQQKSILITDVTAHIGDGTVLEAAAIGFNNGKIDYVGVRTEVDETKYEEVISADNKHVYPGFIALNTSLGLAEIDAVRPTRDYDEIGDFLPHVRSIIAYNSESKVVESMRPNGILMAQICPRGGIIAGSSTVVQLDAWNWEDAIIKVDEGIHLNWPSPYRRGRWWLGEDPSIKSDKNYISKVNNIEMFFETSKVYNKKENVKNLPNEAMSGLFDGSKTLYLIADDEKAIVDGITRMKSIGVKKIVLVSGHESYLQIDFLKKNNIPILIDTPHRLPSNEDQDIKNTFKTAKKLIDADLLVSIDITGRMERMNTRNLPFFAGSFSAYGVPKEEAVKMITYNAAKILGIENSVGTLTVGKDATLFISLGDALDMRTNQISKAYIQGRDISLESHQTELWRRYEKKYNIDIK